MKSSLKLPPKAFCFIGYYGHSMVTKTTQSKQEARPSLISRFSLTTYAINYIRTGSDFPVVVPVENGASCGVFGGWMGGWWTAADRPLATSPREAMA